MKIKELRTKEGKTQQQVANDLNINRMKYNHYELGNSEPNIETLIKLADYYHTTVDEILEHDVPYLINKSQFTPTQLEIIDKIKSLSEDTCQKINAYIEGVKVAEEEKQRIINFYNRGQKWLNI